MQYMFLIYDDERHPNSGTPERLAEYGAFFENVQGAGVFRAGGRLRPVETATTVRAHNGSVATTDGPYAETKEQLAGYFLLDCKDLDEALSYAAKIPSAQDGAIEVRPLWET